MMTPNFKKVINLISKSLNLVSTTNKEGAISVTH